MTQAPTRIPAAIPAGIHERLRLIGRVIDPEATSPLYSMLHRPELPPAAARDVAYGPDARHKLDVFTPAAAPVDDAEGEPLPRPVFVFVHGGGFVGGNKRTPGSPYYDNVMVWASESGLVGVNVTYRLAPDHPWPAAQQDLQAALRWVRENIAEHGGDPERVILVGHSAGAAHVAQYLAHPEFHDIPGGGVAGAILLSGLFDPATCDPTPRLEAYFGTDSSLYAERSALPGLAALDLPLLIAIAEWDPEDFHRQSGLLYEHITGHGGSHAWFYQLDGHNHLSEVYAVGTADEALEALLGSFVRGVVGE